MSDIEDQKEINRLNAENEALRGEVAQGKAKAVSMQKWIDHHNERADKAEQEAARLKGALEAIVAQAPEHSPEMGDDYGANFDDAWSGGWDSGFNSAANIARKALAGDDA